MEKRRNIILLAVFSAGLLLRVYGAGHGLAAGRIFHPDTPKQMMFLRHYLDGDYRVRFRVGHRDYDGYPSFHIHLTEWLYRGASSLARLAGRPPAEPREVDLWFFARVAAALFSAASVLPLYFAARGLFGVKAGLAAAAMFAVNPFSAGMSHFIMGDTAMTFFALWAFYAFSLCRGRQDPRLYLLGGLFLGFAAACKYNGAFIILPGLFVLFLKPGRKTAVCLLALVFGGALGFTIGNPSMFTHFREGMDGTLAFMRHISTVRWDTSQHRLMAAYRAAPGKLRMFAGLFVPFSLAAAGASLVWICWKKRSVKALFAALFPASYLGLAIIAYPALMPLHFLVAVPFFLLLAGWFVAEAGAGKKHLRAGLSVLLGAVLLHGLYASYAESFLFKAGDTRVSAEEWLGRNAPPWLEASFSRYSAEDPRPEHEKDAAAGSFFVSSGLAGMPRPPGGLEVKKFSHEDRTPPVIFRNPDIKVFALPGEHLRPGFTLPLMARAPYGGKLNGPFFPGGAEPGLDPLKFSIGKGKSFMAASKEPLSSVPVLLVNFDMPAEVSVRISGRRRKIRLEPFESRLVVFERPARLPPFNRYYYSFSFSVRDVLIGKEKFLPAVYAAAGLDPAGKGFLYFEAGRYAEAAEEFRRALELPPGEGCFLCPAGKAVMLAVSLDMAGEQGKAAAAAEGVSCWAEDFFGDCPPGAERAAFAEAFLENHGISADFLRAVNTVRFGGEEFTSFRGEVMRAGARTGPPRYSHAVESSDEEGDVVFGPYRPFPPGNYGAKFVFAALPGRPVPEMRAEVAARLGTRVLAEKHIGVFDGPRLEAVLPFRVEEKTEFLEFRSFFEGKGAVQLLHVEVFPDIMMNTMEKAEILRRLGKGGSG